ncbi:TPA: hypothetical protein ACU18R_001909 [Mannheimia haemolytica]
MGYRISKYPQPQDWAGEHYLSCVHKLGRNAINYLMYCNVLKEVSGGRLKVKVFGYRWGRTEGERIRYVEKHKVRCVTDFED